MNGPKGNPVWRKKRERQPGQYMISRVMWEFLSLATWLKKQTLASYFTRNKKSLANLQDCRDYLKSRKGKIK